MIDDGDSQIGFSPGSTAMLNLRSPLYLGGVPAELVSQARSKMKEIGGSFDGCIKDLKINNQQIYPMEKAQTKGLVASCDNGQTEPGSYFTGNFF